MRRLSTTLTTLTAVVLFASLSYAQDESEQKGNLDGRDTAVDIYTDRGTWQIIDDRWIQTDPNAPLAGLITEVEIPARTEYIFDVDISYISGLEDDAGAVGVVLDDFALSLVWDPANLGGSGLFAQVYNAKGELHEYAGTVYNVEVPESIVSDISSEMNLTLELRFHVIPGTGEVSIDNRRDDTTWWKFTLGQPLESRVLGVGTRSVAASFGIEESP